LKPNNLTGREVTTDHNENYHTVSDQLFTF